MKFIDLHEGDPVYALEDGKYLQMYKAGKFEYFNDNLTEVKIIGEGDITYTFLTPNSCSYAVDEDENSFFEFYPTKEDCIKAMQNEIDVLNIDIETINKQIKELENVEV